MELERDTQKSRGRGGSRPVSRRKRLKPIKQRGLYKPRPKALLGLGDPDVAECIFSDDDVRADYMDNNNPEAKEDTLFSDEGSVVDPALCSYSGDSLSCSVSGFPRSSVGTPDISLPISRPSSSCDDRPNSSLSTISKPASVSSVSFIDSPCIESEASVTSDQSASVVVSDTFQRPDSSCSSIQRPESSCSSIQRSEASCSSTAGSGTSATVEIFTVLGAISPPCDEKSSLVCTPSLPILDKLLVQFRSALPAQWVPIADTIGIHLILLPLSTPKTVLREVVLFYDGKVSIFVNSATIMSKQILLEKPAPSLDIEDSTLVEAFCKRGIEIINLVMDYNICVGANSENTRFLWSTTSQAFIDYNPYRNDGYSETCRSENCQWLVKKHKQRNKCSACKSILEGLRKRMKSGQQTEVGAHTRNDYLTHAQALHKIQDQAIKIRQKDKRINYLEKRIKQILEKDGVDIDEELSSDLQKILSETNLTDIQQAFLREQVEASKKRDSRSHRWHPAMIRFALHVRMTAGKSGYDAIRDAGVLRLPCQRTLFDYSNSILPEVGVSQGIIKLVQEKVKNYKEEFKSYHTLLCDEMYISKNLVYRQSDNSLVGYQHLDEVDKEMQKFDTYVEHLFSGKEEKTELKLAKTMLAYMVKGVASDVKFVVAAYPTTNMTADGMYVRSWEVISRLERADVKIIAFICDHASTNRAFFDLHTPITSLKSGVVFDTRNFCSPEGRPLFLIADVCHLLKTVRNSFYNSGDGPKKPRCLQLNGKKIVWKTIVRLYLTFKNNIFRKSYKLNAQNVFPNSYSCMKVRYAAQVMSDTVALDIEDQKWPDTEETVRFIRYVNKFFDCLNGAHSTQHIRTGNKNLAPYCNENDKRFAWLGVPEAGHENDNDDERLSKPFLQYLQDWKKQVSAFPIKDTEKEKMMLCYQTQNGIERSIHGIAGAIRYLLRLKEPASFICPRVFSQDPLEQHFSLQRQGRGGSSNPNSAQFQSKQVQEAVKRDLGVKFRRSNVESTETGMKWSNDPVPKRKRKKNCKN